MNIMSIFLYLYILLKPFYVFKSGGMQPADFFLVAAFIVFVLNKKNRIKLKCIIFENRKFLLFLFLTFVINGIYFITYVKTKFLLSSLYFVFNFLAIILFSVVFEDEKLTKNISNILKVNIVIQLVVYFLGLGRWYGFTRYMGTFNDPNQFGYYILMSYMFIYLTTIKYRNYKGNIMFLLLSIFLIVQCASTGMFIAILLFVFLQIFSIIKNIGKFIQKNKVKIFLSIVIIVPLISIFLVLADESFYNKFKNMLIIDRVIEKLNKVDNENESDISLIQERGYDRFIYYPQYILFGSGEGEYTRFTKTYHQDEIHATFPSILFYYGLIPTLILLSWIYDKIKKSNAKVLIPILAIFLESFTLLNQRQVMFWVIILFAGFIKRGKIGDANENSICS